MESGIPSCVEASICDRKLARMEPYSGTLRAPTSFTDERASKSGYSTVFPVTVKLESRSMTTSPEAKELPMPEMSSSQLQSMAAGTSSAAASLRRKAGFFIFR